LRASAKSRTNAKNILADSACCMSEGHFIKLKRI